MIPKSAIQQNYQYSDNPLQESVIYYRLKTVDMDNQFTYSYIRSVGLNANKSVLVYPNPVAKGKSLIFEHTENDVFDLKIQDLQGRVIFKTSFSKQINVNLNDVSRGLYIYELTSKDTAQYGKVVLE